MYGLEWCDVCMYGMEWWYVSVYMVLMKRVV